MKKKFLGIIISILLIAGCGKIPTLSNGSEAVVTFKNGEMISVDELYEKVKNTYALSSLMTLIDMQVFESAFPDYTEEAKESAESYMNALAQNYATEDELLRDIQTNTGLASIEAYQEYIYLNYLQSNAIKNYAKEQITDKEIKKYYEDEVVGDIEVSHILITPEVTDKMTEEEIKDAEAKAKEKAENLIKELKDAKNLTETFEKLAKENSMDDATKEKGGSLGKINKATLEDSYDELVDAAYNLKDGAYSKKVITTELGYHVIMKTKSHEKASLEDSKEDIIETLSTDLINTDRTLAINALQHYRKEQGVEIQDSELQKQYAYYIQNQLASANNMN